MGARRAEKRGRGITYGAGNPAGWRKGGGNRWYCSEGYAGMVAKKVGSGFSKRNAGITKACRK